MFGDWGTGFASGVSGGILTDIHEASSGQKVEPKYSVLFNAGNITGIGVSFLVGMRAATWASTSIGSLKWIGVSIGAVETGISVYGAGKATKNLNDSYQENGKFEIEDAWNLLAYIPFAGSLLGVRQFISGSRAVKGSTESVNGVMAAKNTVTKTGNCFVAGTEILTIEGEKNIEDIQVGDWVIADDPTTPGEIESKQVLETFVRHTTALVDIYIDGEVISTTGEHPFWTPDLGWVEAKGLHVGSLLQTEDGRIIDVDGVDKREGDFTVYNFKVEGFHTYFVSDLGILVHNNCDSSSGLVKVVEEDPTNAGRSFARYDPITQQEMFSARLEEGGHLQMAWIETGTVRQVADNIREIQRFTGQKITKIYGNASDGILGAIEAGNFNSQLYEKTLARRLGGAWQVETIPRQGQGSGWNIIATRIGD
ncbi:polymorphic toxin-type HINT domain-containing protein [Tumidithrix elongata RA019]|uniref:Polymorphic toxin-type HINT domain-containing protein n=1 Tax=Tumidithrix elongata BACA0141 TaxID=2716417 RepID=A0AAW9Q948_9CYAN|nr:polymorphic toxin-type HINT domain-containing protein [Tumidithrix elongata RA019]